MFWILRWFLISILAIVVTLGLAFGFKQLQNKYYPAYQMDEFADNDYMGNTGSLRDAINNGVALLDAQKYRVFLKSYIPEEGRAEFRKHGKNLDALVERFRREEGASMLSFLQDCANDKVFKMSDGGHKGLCKTKRKIAGKNKMTFVKQKGSWRLQN